MKNIPERFNRSNWKDAGPFPSDKNVSSLKKRRMKKSVGGCGWFSCSVGSCCHERLWPGVPLSSSFLLVVVPVLG